MMAQGDGAFYNEAKLRLFNGIFNLANGGNSLYLGLHDGYTPDIDAHGEWGDTGVSSTEFASAAGYTAGEDASNLLGSQATAQDNTNNRASFDGADHTWTALGPLADTPSHVTLRAGSVASDPLILYWELGGTPIGAPNGGNYTLSFGANGIALLT
jgi:hypothetical protein